jgi:hypothetical protein
MASEEGHMDGRRFDRWARVLATQRSRRGFLATVLGLGAGLAGMRATGAATCLPGQVYRRGLGCICKATGRPPVNGACPCPAGTTSCPAGCVDLRRDPTNCGVCGRVCPTGLECSGGQCVCTPTSCAGCCDTEGTCRPGWQSQYCGKDGAPCEECPELQICEFGVCTGGPRP